MIREIHKKEILATVTVCPYCMDPVNCEQPGCCGESSAHFAEAYDLGDDIVLVDDVTAIPDGAA